MHALNMQSRPRMPACHNHIGQHATKPAAYILMSSPPVVLHYTQASGYPNECFLPQRNAGPDVTSLYGVCEFYDDNVSATSNMVLTKSP